MICLLKVRPPLADHLAMLGHLPHIVAILERTEKVKDMGNPDSVSIANSALQLINVLSENEECIKRFQSTNVMSILLSSLQPLHTFAAYSLETIKKLIANNPRGPLLAQALTNNIISFFVQLIDDPMSDVKDFSGAKVNVIEALKLLAEDKTYGEQASNLLNAFPVWSQYRSQKHGI